MNVDEFLKKINEMFLPLFRYEINGQEISFNIWDGKKFNKLKDMFNGSASERKSYLNGLADVIGELRRSSLDSLRHDDVSKAEQLLSKMEDILEGLQSFDYPNALVPDLRRKCDVGRALVERTRGDLTRAVGQSRLVKELADFEKRIGNDE